MKDYSSILITGASSGIGRALAIDLSAENRTLCLLGRDLKKLKEVQNICENKKAKVFIFSVDITDQISLNKVILDYDANYPVDLVIANAGIGTGQSQKLPKKSLPSMQVIQTNILGVHYTLDPLITRFKERKKGQIAIMSSLASFRGFRLSYIYNATKAYLRIYGQGLRIDLKASSIHVSTIAPGFVKTPLTDCNHFKMPFIISAEKASHIILKGLKKNKSLIVFPKILYFIIRCFVALPQFIADKIAEKVI